MEKAKPEMKFRIADGLISEVNEKNPARTGDSLVHIVGGNAVSILSESVYQNAEERARRNRAIAAVLIFVTGIIIGYLICWYTHRNKVVASKPSAATQSQPAATGPSASTAPAAATTDPETAAESPSEAGKMVPIRPTKWPNMGSCLTDATLKLYGDSSMDAVHAAIDAGAYGPGLPDRSNPNLILADLIWMPVSIKVHGKLLSLRKEAIDHYPTNATLAKPTSQVRASRALRSITVATHHITRHSTATNLALALNDILSISANLATFNVRANVPTANIAAIGTVGLHAPPTSDALKKECPCGNNPFSV